MTLDTTPDSNLPQEDAELLYQNENTLDKVQPALEVSAETLRV